MAEKANISMGCQQARSSHPYVSRRAQQDLLSSSTNFGDVLLESVMQIQDEIPPSFPSSSSYMASCSPIDATAMRDCKGGRRETSRPICIGSTSITLHYSALQIWVQGGPGRGWRCMQRRPSLCNTTRPLPASRLLPRPSSGKAGLLRIAARSGRVRHRARL